MTAAKAFEPARSVIVSPDARLAAFLITFLGSQEERDAVVGARDNQGGVTGMQAFDEIAAQSVANEDGFVTTSRHRVDPPLDLCGSGTGGVVKPLGEKLQVQKTRGAGRHVADLAKGDLAGDDLVEMLRHGAAVRSAAPRDARSARQLWLILMQAVELGLDPDQGWSDALVSRNVG